MATQIFLNLGVKDLNRSIEFFTKLGYTFNAQFSNEKATCMIISDTIYVMLLTEPFFQTFTTKRIIDAHNEVECSICISKDSKDAVNKMVDKAVAAGATIPNPATDYGFMYQHSFADLDGHHWEFMWMGTPMDCPSKWANNKVLKLLFGLFIPKSLRSKRSEAFKFNLLQYNF